MCAVFDVNEAEVFLVGYVDERTRNVCWSEMVREISACCWIQHMTDGFGHARCMEHW